ncbi:MAG: hypothetical protein AUH17_08470 [Actinobacteria bacterium 13_2_20CM_68_14]|nr:MAG: hypothetical protein AUH17_08470 [Actinobacteria bacterium 13_2_20CM_68_14]
MNVSRISRHAEALDRTGSWHGEGAVGRRSGVSLRSPRKIVQDAPLDQLVRAGIRLQILLR